MRTSPGKLLFLLIWSYNCIQLEGLHPMQGGYLRRKYRRDRRPALPVESPFVFYPRYVRDLVVKHVRLARMVWRGMRFRHSLKRDPNAIHYTDIALTPVHDGELESLELFSITDAAKSSAGKVRRQNELARQP